MLRGAAAIADAVSGLAGVEARKVSDGTFLMHFGGKSPGGAEKHATVVATDGNDFTNHQQRAGLPGLLRSLLDAGDRDFTPMLVAHSDRRLRQR